MDVRLKVLTGGRAGTTVRIAGPKFFIGRSAACHLRPRSEAIGEYHCALVLGPDQVTVFDFGSDDGTYVNGQRIASPTPLNSGDHLRIGPLEFEVVIAPAGSTPGGVPSANDTAKLSLEETDAGEGPQPPRSGEPGNTEDSSAPQGAAPLSADEQATQALRRLRRYR